MPEEANTFDIGVGERASHIRHILSLSQQDVAQKLQITRQTLANYESGKTPMRASVIRQLCEIYGCSAGWLLGMCDVLKISRIINGRSLELNEISPSISIKG